MGALLTTLLLLPLVQAASSQSGDPSAGMTVWRGQLCRNCHGAEGQGGFGPDLAGRGLTLEQFRRAIRQPWGVMPSYGEQQISDEAIANLQAFLSQLPRVSTPGKLQWSHPSSDSPPGQRYQAAFGCAQCHEPELRYPRRWLGGAGPDYAYFAQQIYDHTVKFPRGRMGSYSRDRLAEPMLREIYSFMEQVGFLANVSASMRIAEGGSSATTYSVTVINEGVVGKGLTAEDLTLFVRVPQGSTVMGTTGDGYAGTRALAQLGLAPGLLLAPHAEEGQVPVRPPPDLTGDVMVWRSPAIAPGEKRLYTFTLSGSPPSAEFLRRFEGSTVHWMKPTVRLPAPLRFRDLRLPDEGDNFAIPLPQLPTAQPR